MLEFIQQLGIWMRTCGMADVITETEACCQFIVVKKKTFTYFKVHFLYTQQTLSQGNSLIEPV